MIFVPGFGWLSDRMAKWALELKGSEGLEVGERIDVHHDIAARIGYNRPPESGVQSGVQHPEEGGKSA